MECVADLDPASLSTHDHYTRLQHSRGAMGPDQKVLQVKLDKHFAAQEKRFYGLERKLDSTVLCPRLPPIWMCWSRQHACSTNGAPASMASSMTFASRSTNSQPYSLKLERSQSTRNAR